MWGNIPIGQFLAVVVPFFGNGDLHSCGGWSCDAGGRAMLRRGSCIVFFPSLPGQCWTVLGWSQVATCWAFGSWSATNFWNFFHTLL
ncbi:hypothetical protein B0T19DRAFT_432178 [Cercophora scortea]|uniref:Uncharacterized protein n=1 Tax=Cercophora scortea TaxID=314031 RepID=A0AAE0IAZ7_9PEZI|nr:hypothetical protein B0T19DRAFT_432178 [Cercophora scortea]